MKKFAAIACMIVLGVQPAAAETASVFCTYDILVSTHFIAKSCGKPLDSAAEARYQKLVLDMANFIVANRPAMNGKVDPLTFHADNIKRREAARTSPILCQDVELLKFVDLLKKLTSETNARQITDGLKTPRNPDEGACL